MRSFQARASLTLVLSIVSSLVTLEPASAHQPTPASQPATSQPAAPAASPAATGTGVVDGVVVDAQSGLPLPGAAVSVVGLTVSIVSDGKGMFQFAALPAGQYKLHVEHVGYQPTVSDSVTLINGEEARVTLALQRVASGTQLRTIANTSTKGEPVAPALERHLSDAVARGARAGRHLSRRRRAAARAGRQQRHHGRHRFAQRRHQPEHPRDRDARDHDDARRPRDRLRHPGRLQLPAISGHGVARHRGDLRLGWQQSARRRRDRRRRRLPDDQPDARDAPVVPAGLRLVRSADVELQLHGHLEQVRVRARPRRLRTRRPVQELVSAESRRGLRSVGAGRLRVVPTVPRRLERQRQDRALQTALSA